jgi:hypothetical protein
MITETRLNVIVLPVKEQDRELFKEFLTDYLKAHAGNLVVSTDLDQVTVVGDAENAYDIGYAFAEWKCWKRSAVKKLPNILEHAHDIVFKRNEEKERQYGPFHESMVKTAKLATLMGDKDLTAKDCLNVMVALKLARESYAHKYDNLLDAIAYLAQKNNSAELE